MTRRFSRERTRSLALLLAFAAGALEAATPPDAGQSLQQLQPVLPPAAPQQPAPALETQTPAAAAPADATPIPVQQVVLTGNTAIASAELLALVADLPGRSHTLAELQAATARLTAHYRAQGYLLARAYLPAQEMTGGTLTIAILEGRVDKVVVQNDSRVGTPQLQAVLGAQLPAGQSVRKAAVNRAMLLLQQTPGVGVVQGRLRPGAEVGSTEVNVKAGSAPRASGHVTLDNAGNRYTGRGRLLGGIDFDSLAGYGDRLSVQGVVTEKDQLDYARLAWDAPLDNDGMRVGAAFSNTRYELGETFAALGARGTARTVSLYGNHPLLLTPSNRVRLGLTLEHRALHDEQTSVALDSRKSADTAVLALEGSVTDTLLGSAAGSAWRIAGSFGRLDLETASAKAIDAVTARTAGDYGKLVASASREQRLPDAFSLYVSGTLQASSRNLDSSEQLVLGGATAVRAYPTGEAVGDEGWLATAELRWRVTNGLRLDAFYDAGHIETNREPFIAAANGRSLAGGGIAATAARKGFTLAGSLAWRDGEAPTSDRDRHPRGWVSGSYSF